MVRIGDHLLVSLSFWPTLLTWKFRRRPHWRKWGRRECWYWRCIGVSRCNYVWGLILIGNAARVLDGTMSMRLRKLSMTFCLCYSSFIQPIKPTSHYSSTMFLSSCSHHLGDGCPSTCCFRWGSTMVYSWAFFGSDRRADKPSRSLPILAHPTRSTFFQPPKAILDMNSISSFTLLYSCWF